MKKKNYKRFKKDLDKYYERMLENANDICDERNREDRIRDAARRNGDDIGMNELI